MANLSSKEKQFRAELRRPDLLTGLIRNNNSPVQSFERLHEESEQLALKWVKSHLSPATTDNDGVAIPDGLNIETIKLSRQAFFDMNPDANGTIALFMLPFLEAPVAQLDTSTNALRIFQDPALGGAVGDADWMKASKLYGFRCAFQSITAYNTTSLMDLQGNVVAALMPSQIDSHCMNSTGFGRRWVRVIDNLPLSTSQVMAATRKPYMGAAKDGIYIVNRSFTNDYSMINRDIDFQKATATEYHVNASNAVIEGFSSRNSLAFKLANGNIAFGSLTSASGVLDDTLAADSTVGVTGTHGTGYGMGVVFFTGLKAGASFRIKLVHGYEFVAKPGSNYIPVQSRCPTRQAWAFKAVNLQLQDKALVFPADANFFGALLQGLTKVLPFVMPVAKNLWPLIQTSVGKLMAKGDKKIEEMEKAKQAAKAAALLANTRSRGPASK